MAVMLSGWEGNRGPDEKIAAYHWVYNYVTCGLTALTGISSGPNTHIKYRLPLPLALLAANKLQRWSGLSSASLVASSTLRLWYDRSFFTVANQEV